MERAPGDGHSLAKMTVVESSGQIETCRWEYSSLPPFTRSFQYPIWKTFQYWPKHRMILRLF